MNYDNLFNMRPLDHCNNSSATFNKFHVLRKDYAESYFPLHNHVKRHDLVKMYKPLDRYTYQKPNPATNEPRHC